MQWLIPFRYRIRQPKMFQNLKASFALLLLVQLTGCWGVSSVRIGSPESDFVPSEPAQPLPSSVDFLIPGIAIPPFNTDDNFFIEHHVDPWINSQNEVTMHPEVRYAIHFQTFNPVDALIQLLLITYLKHFLIC